MKIVLREDQLKLGLMELAFNEMAYPISFNFDEFKNIKSYNGKVQYCNTHLQRLSSGSSRIVYRVDDEKVLKLAKNKKGLAQNKAEYNSYAQETGISANVFDCDTDNFYWIEMELAQKCTPNSFKQILGYTFDFVQNFIDYVYSWYARRNRNGYNPNAIYDKKYQEKFEELTNEQGNNWEWFSMLTDYMTNTGLESIGDLKRISSWGIVKRNGNLEIVLIDFGMDDEVFGAYYSGK